MQQAFLCSASGGELGCAVRLYFQFDNRDCSLYEIAITFTSFLDVASPRAGLQASEDIDEAEVGFPAHGYSYSGQSFDACKYTSCPVRKNKLSTYTYPFFVYHSVSCAGWHCVLDWTGGTYTLLRNSAGSSLTLQHTGTGLRFSVLAFPSVSLTNRSRILRRRDTPRRLSSSNSPRRRHSKVPSS